MNTTKLIHQLEHLRGLDYQGVCGKFHSHVTVEVSEQAQIEQLKGWCRERKIKLTVIDLERQERTQRDVMTTQHYRIEEPDAVAQIVDKLKALSLDLEAHGYEVLRVKLEHESLPTLPRFSAHQYREVHIKLHLKPERYEQDMMRLKQLGQQQGFVPSSNPNERTHEHIAQFVNMRLYDGELAQTEAKIQQVIEALQAHELVVAQVKAETTILDTNLALDRWWA